MKRLIVVVDALRRDYAKDVLMPFFDCRFHDVDIPKFHEVESIDNWTNPVFNEYAKAMSHFNGWVGLITGGGWSGREKVNYSRLDYYDASEYNTIPNWEKLVNKVNSPDKDKILILHCYYLHNYWEELNINPSFNFPHKETADMLKFYYKKRTIEIAKPLIELLEHFDDWEKYVISDHGEALFEDGKSFFHHQREETPKEVKDNFIMDWQDRDNINQLQLFRGD